MTVKKILALSLALIMALSMAACGAKDADTTTAPTEATTDFVETSAAADGETTEAVSESESASIIPEESATEAVSDAEETTEANALDTVEGVIEFYKEAAAKTDKAGNVKTNDVMSLTNLNGGSGAVGALINLFEPIAKKALSKNSGTGSSITGGYKDLKASDVVSATAKDDGKFTTVTIVPKVQVDGVNGQSKSGTVGHVVSVLGGVDTAIKELDGVKVDYSEGKIQLKYTDAKATVKIDNATGKIVSGTWTFNVNASLDNIKVKIGIISATLDGATAVINYNISM